MSKIRFFGAAASLSVLIASPASAQHMIDEPGMYAFCHSTGDLGIRLAARCPGDGAAPRDAARAADAIIRMRMRK